MYYSLYSFSLKSVLEIEQPVRYVAPPTIRCHAYRGTNRQLHTSKAWHESSYNHIIQPTFTIIADANFLEVRKILIAATVFLDTRHPNFHYPASHPFLASFKVKYH